MAYFRKSKDKISNEARLILFCARIEMDSLARCEVEKILIQPIDWDNIVERSIFHGVAPLVYYNLNKINLNTGSIPQGIILKMKDCYYRTLFDNLRFWKEFQDILNVANSAKIKVVPIKGLVLSHTLYFNIGLRPMLDIDLLIQEDNLVCFEQAIFRLGYKKYLDNQSENYWRKYHHHFSFKKDNCDLVIDAHWDLSLPRPNKILFPMLWQRIQEETVDGVKISVLSPEDSLFCLVLHLRKHTRRLILRHICDIAELLKQKENCFDWEYIIKEAEKNRIKSTLYFALLSARQILDAPLPVSILDKIKPNVFRCWLMSIFTNKNSFCEKEFNRREILNPKYFLLRFLLLDRISDFFSYILFSPIESLARFYARHFPYIRW